MFALPPAIGPSPAPANSAPAVHLTSATLHDLGFRGYTIAGVECILPPLCPVPGGIFTMGSDTSRDKQADDDETPQCTVETLAFAIGQHPVTVAEYARAVRAKVVGEPPAFAFAGTKTDWATQQTHPDHPVVCVSWNDTLAYANWLAKTTGQPWRLPSEAEWEKAARGDDGRIYPWGDVFSYNTELANATPRSMRKTSPVGNYPNGASPYGVEDMAGNVWEWTSSHYWRYPYSKDDGREDLNRRGDRVMRGGSWSDSDRRARAASRIGDGPDYRYNYYGFRLAWAAGSA